MSWLKIAVLETYLYKCVLYIGYQEYGITKTICQKGNYDCGSGAIQKQLFSHVNSIFQALTSDICKLSGRSSEIISFSEA